MKVVQGTVYIPVVNVGTTDIVLYPRVTIDTLGCVDVVSLPSEVSEVQPVAVSASVQAVQVTSVRDQIDSLDLSRQGWGRDPAGYIADGYEGQGSDAVTSAAWAPGCGTDYPAGTTKVLLAGHVLRDFTLVPAL